MNKIAIICKMNLIIESYKNVLNNLGYEDVLIFYDLSSAFPDKKEGVADLYIINNEGVNNIAIINFIKPVQKELSNSKFLILNDEQYNNFVPAQDLSNTYIISKNINVDEFAETIKKLIK